MMSPRTTNEPLRVALLAGTLAQGGAEKQLVYMARALQQAGVELQVYCLTRGEYYEADLDALGLSPTWIGKSRNPIARVRLLRRHLKKFRPHIVQGIHFYTNLHVELAAGVCGAVAIGSIRNDTDRELKANRFWGKPLLRYPKSILANSEAARRRAVQLGRSPDSMHVLTNALDLDEFDNCGGSVDLPEAATDRICVAMVCRLVAAKRVDRFLEAFTQASRLHRGLHALVVGDGPLLAELEATAVRLGLGPHEMSFLGQRNDVPALLRNVDMLAISSDHEGLPNVALEAMSAGKPVIATPAGDAGTVVDHTVTGTIVAFDDISAMATEIVRLADSEELRGQMGAAGRKRVEDHYAYSGLLPRLLNCYLDIARQQGHSDPVAAILRHQEKCPSKQVAASQPSMAATP